MEAGQLNRRITIQQRVEEQRPGGQVVDQWKDVARLWSWVKTQSGMGAAKQVGGEGTLVTTEVPYSFRIRYRPNIMASMRVLYQGSVFDIIQVRHDLANRVWTDLVCTQGISDG